MKNIGSSDDMAAPTHPMWFSFEDSLPGLFVYDTFGVEAYVCEYKTEVAD